MTVSRKLVASGGSNFYTLKSILLRASCSMQARGTFLQDTFIDGKKEHSLHYRPKTQLIRSLFPIKKLSRKRRTKPLSWLADKLSTLSGSISDGRSVLYNLADLKYIEFLFSLVLHNLIFRKGLLTSG